MNYDVPKDEIEWLNQQKSSLPLFETLPATYGSGLGLGW